MTIKDFNTKKKHKLSMYLSKHLKNKRYDRINGVKYLSFTKEEAHNALMQALRMAHNKKDAKEFLACIRYSASDASEKILKELSKNT